LFEETQGIDRIAEVSVWNLVQGLETWRTAEY
jgi:hypothetical protein